MPRLICVAAVLQERAVMSQAETAQFVRELREAFNHLDALPMPTVGECQQPCGRQVVRVLPLPGPALCGWHALLLAGTFHAK